MLPRTARKLETTLVSYSRQRLPRPARYSTPSKRANAPALQHAYAAQPEYPAFMPALQTPQAGDDAPLGTDMEGFLQRRQNLTIMSALPPDDTLAGREYYTDTPTQDRLALMDACLYNLNDVPRAKIIFEQLRVDTATAKSLPVKLYNSLLHAYLRMAEDKDSDNRVYWVDEMWLLFRAMEDGSAKMRPTENTYALMVLSWQK